MGNEIKRDYLGNVLELGDEVVFVQLGYRNFWKGVIIKMTNKRVMISHAPTNTCSIQTIQEYKQVIKIPLGE